MKAPQLVVISIIIREGKFLLVKRARPPCKDMWSIIGGKSIMEDEYASDPLQASKEEVMIDLQCDYVHPTFYTYKYVEEEKPILRMFFYGDIAGTPKKNPAHISEYRWFSVDEINNIDLAFQQKEVVHRFAKEFT